MKILFTSILISYCFLVAGQEDRKVAVFDPAGSIDKTLLEIVREEISSAVVNTEGYTVLERQLLNKVMEENEFQASGLVSDTQVSNIGRLMGADYVFVSTVSILGNNYYISCKMIEVATARIDKQFTGTTTDGMNDIPQTVLYVVKRLFGENVKQPVVRRQREPSQQQPEEPKQSEQHEQVEQTDNPQQREQPGTVSFSKWLQEYFTPEKIQDTPEYIPANLIDPANVVDDMRLLEIVVKKVKVFYQTYRKGDIAWFDETSARYYIAKRWARTFYPDNESSTIRVANKKVLVEFNRETKHHLGDKYYLIGDLAWFNDDIGEYYVRKKVAIYK
ncbi:MAG: CsgG/HfaB family protein [Tannerella sp.]|jgi:hypothetical protein|nr:CsgG/HfaB family protein [Tannerella sp.]